MVCALIELAIIKFDIEILDVALVVSYRIVALVVSYILALKQLAHSLFKAKYREEKICILSQSVACSEYFCV